MGKGTYASFTAFKRILTLSSQYKKWYVILILLSVISSVIGVGVMESIRRIVTGATDGNASMIYGGALIGLTVILVRFANNMGITWLNATFNNMSITHFQASLFKAISLKKLTHLEAYQSADLTNRVMESVPNAQAAINEKFVAFFTSVIQIIAAITYFSWLNIELTVGIIAFTLIYPLVTYPLTGIIARKYDQRNDAVANKDMLIQETSQGNQHIRALSLSHFMSARFRKRLDRVLNKNIHLSVYNGMLNFANQTFTFGGMIFILCFGGYQVLQGRLEIGGLTAFLIASGQLSHPLRSIASLWTQLIESLSHAHRVFAVIDLEEEASRSDISVALDHKIELEINDLAYTYGEDPKHVAALQHISFTAQSNTINAIVGPSGAGKSTLIKLLVRLYEPSAGRILCNGVNVSELDLDEWRSHIAMVTQDALIFTGTVRDNIALGRPEASEAEIIAAAKLANIHKTIAKLPGGYDSEMGEGGSNFSGGEIQRIALARALVRHPRILILDEPTASLDAQSEKVFNDTLSTIAQDKIIFVVTHRLAMARLADNIIYIEDGQLIETGKHEQLYEAKGAYYTMINTQIIGEQRT